MVRLLSAASTVLLAASTVVADNWPFQTLETAPFVPPEMHVRKSGKTDPGYIFVGPRGNQPQGTAALIYDQDGHLVYQGPTEVTANFKVQKLYNEDVLHFWAGEMTDWGFGYGTVHILDNTYREIYTVTLTGNFVTPDVPRESYIDLHESHITSRNTLLVTAYNATQWDLRPLHGLEDGWMVNALFYEIDIATNEVVFEWSALDHVDEIPLTNSIQTIAPGFGVLDHPYDAYHINSVELMDDGYIISFRHYWSGFYIGNDGHVKWQLSGRKGDGDFEIDDAGEFSWQHDIRVYNQTDERLILNLFNNAATPDRQYALTTGLSFDVDLVNHTVTTLRTLSNPKDEQHSVSQGSYQLINEDSNHVFLGYGSIATVKEFDANDKEVFSASFGEPGIVASYRAYKCEWKATPFWQPSVKVDRTSDSTAEVFMSWNGATEYDNWAMYSAESLDASDTTFIKSVKRTGFETRGDVGGLDAKFIQVVARKGSIPLGTSPTVEF